LIAAGLWLAVDATAAEEIRIAVAANFSSAAEALTVAFESQTEHEIGLIFGSTGRHYAQIRNGAPFDIFLAADVLHPRLLEDDDLAISGTRFTYARGALVLWSPLEGFVDGRGEVLTDGDYRHLAMANPDLAPYGLAARQVLESLGLWKQLQGGIVRGENVGQAFQFVASGNAELGFVALSQITRPGHEIRAGSSWRVPQQLYVPIDQQAALLTDTAAAREFLEFIRSEAARAIIHQFGYTVPASDRP